MPDYRKLSNGHGNSRTLTELPDFDFRVWLQYRASADDFGVCPLSPAKLQGDNRRLAKESTAKVLRAMKGLIECGLVLVFTHQGQDYLCQATWQDFEDIRYPRQTLHPVPSAEVFGLLSEKTAELFREHRKKDSAKFPHLACAGTRETQTLTLIHTQTQTEAERAESRELADVWARIVAAIEAAGVPDHSLRMWFHPCRVVGLYPDAIRVEVPSALTAEWLTKHYAGAMAEAVAHVAPGRKVRYDVAARRAS